MKIHDIEQNSMEWYELRAGRITGTCASVLLTNGRNGNGLGTGAMSLIFRKIAESVTGPTVSEPNYWMDRGKELEPIARQEYENETFCQVQQVGFISSGDLIGFSPDGLIEDDGLIEIKCSSATEFVRFAVTQKVDASHTAQIQYGLWVSGRKWCDYVMFHPEFEKPLQVLRIQPDPKMFEVFEEKTKIIQELIRDFRNKL